MGAWGCLEGALIVAITCWGGMLTTLFKNKAGTSRRAAVVDIKQVPPVMVAILMAVVAMIAAMVAAVVVEVVAMTWWRWLHRRCGSQQKPPCRAV